MQWTSPLQTSKYTIGRIHHWRINEYWGRRLCENLREMVWIFDKQHMSHTQMQQSNCVSHSLIQPAQYAIGGGGLRSDGPKKLQKLQKLRLWVREIAVGISVPLTKVREKSIKTKNFGRRAPKKITSPKKAKPKEKKWFRNFENNFHKFWLTWTCSNGRTSCGY